MHQHAIGQGNVEHRVGADAQIARAFAQRQSHTGLEQITLYRNEARILIPIGDSIELIYGAWDTLQRGIGGGKGGGRIGGRGQAALGGQLQRAALGVPDGMSARGPVPGIGQHPEAQTVSIHACSP